MQAHTLQPHHRRGTGEEPAPRLDCCSRGSAHGVLPSHLLPIVIVAVLLHPAWSDGHLLLVPDGPCMSVQVALEQQAQSTIL